MSLYNDYLQQSEKAKFNAQQAALSGDKRLQDMYNSSAEQLFIRAMNLKMEEDGKRMLEQQRQMQEQQKRFEEQQREMQIQQYLNQKHYAEDISDGFEEYGRFKAWEEDREKIEKVIEEAFQQIEEGDIERKENMTFLQKTKEEIKKSILRTRLNLGLY